jgi:hypothetical protein
MSVFRIVLPSPIIHTEVSMIQASLLNGAYVSQYDMRATANPGVAQYLEKVPSVVVSSEMYRLPVFVSLRPLTAAEHASFFCRRGQSWMLVGHCGDVPGTNIDAEQTAATVMLHSESYCDSYPVRGLPCVSLLYRF